MVAAGLVENILFVVGMVLLCVVALLSVKRAEDLFVVLAVWIILVALYLGLKAIFLGA
jgi:hypothetical protein